MQLFLSILITVICMPWPALIMMSPMMIAASGFASNKSSIILAMLFFIYPSFFFVALHVMEYAFYGSDPIWWATATLTIGLLVSFIYGLPRKLYNTFNQISNYDYFIKNNAVYFNGERIKHADASTFTHFNNNAYYSKDVNHVYYNTKKLKGADAATFQPLANDETGSYWHDKHNAYYKWMRIPDADGASFTYAGYDYAFDKNHVFFQNQLVKEADRSTFQALRLFVGRDAKNVFIQSNRVTNIKDIESFEIVTISEDFFGKDKDQIYVFRYTQPHPLLHFPDADLDTFEVIGEYYAKDKNKVYYYSYHANGILVLEGANPETFILQFDPIRRTNATDGIHHYKAGLLSE